MKSRTDRKRRRKVTIGIKLFICTKNKSNPFVFLILNIIAYHSAKLFKLLKSVVSMKTGKSYILHSFLVSNFHVKIIER